MELDRLLKAVNTVSGIRIWTLLETRDSTMSAAHIAETLDINENTAYRALGRLWRLGVIEPVYRIHEVYRAGPKTTFWRLVRE